MRGAWARDGCGGVKRRGAVKGRKKEKASGGRPRGVGRHARARMCVVVLHSAWRGTWSAELYAGVESAAPAQRPQAAGACTRTTYKHKTVDFF